MNPMAQTISGHSFCEHLDEQQIEKLADCASRVRFDAETYLLRDGQSAERCYLLLSGRVAIEMRTPSRGSLIIQTLGGGEVLGWSWLLPPYRWHLDARALEPVEAIVLDGPRLRQACSADPLLGYSLLQRVTGLLLQRLMAARLQLVDLYGKPE